MGELDGLVAGRGGHVHGLGGQHVLAGPQTLHGDLAMASRRRYDIHHLYRGILQKHVDVVGIGHAILFANGLGFLEIDIAHAI